MAKARAINHMILGDGTFVKRGTVLDDQDVAEHLRKENLDYEDLSGRQGKVMVLYETSYQEKQMLNGHPAWFPTTVQAGAIVEREKLPSGCKEGIHFLTEWDEKTKAKVMHQAAEREQKLLMADPLEVRESGGIPGIGGWSVR